MGVAIKGGKELSAFLAQLPARLEKNAVRSALRAGAAQFRDEARRLVPKESGKLAKAIKTSSPNAEKSGLITIKVSVDRKSPHAFLGYFFEYGVTAHDIAPGKRKRALKLDADVFRGIVHHPGFGAHPFMRPAADRMAAAAVTAFAERLGSYLKDKAGLDAPDVEIEGEED